MNTAHQYALDVKAGEITACKWVRLACKRFLKDLKRSETDPSFPYKYNPPLTEIVDGVATEYFPANRAVEFIELLPHVKGRWAANKETITLQPWQVFIVCSIFGWVHKETGLRRFDKASLYVARKNGKSLLAAAIGLYMLVVDKEAGAEVYSGATSEKQAWEVFGPARKMAEKMPELQSHYDLEVNASNLCTLDGSKFEPIIGNPGDGASPHCAIVDEYHEHKDSKQYDTMLTGMGSRLQPLMLVITTAGDNIAGPCFDDMTTVEKILEGVIEDERHFGIIFTIDKADDWTSREALQKANPNIGVSISEDFLLARQKEAIENSRHQGRFKTKHLNIWVSARDAFFNMQKWSECEDAELKLSDFEGQYCIISVDLASKRDIAEVHLVFPREDDKYIDFGIHYLPEAAVEAEANNHYRAWDTDGFLVATEGNMIDMPRMKDDVLDLCKRFTVGAVVFDPYHDTYMMIKLMDEGVTCTEYAATVKNFSDPMKLIDALTHEKKISHPIDPVMDWMISNVVARVDNKDNVYPNKERPELKIDGPVALIMAMGWHLENPEPAASSYEDENVQIWID